MTDLQLAELKNKAEALQERARGWQGWFVRRYRSQEVELIGLVRELVSELQRRRLRCAQVEEDCRQLQRDYDRLRYGSEKPPPRDVFTSTLPERPRQS
jgi:hypothetical protein